MPMPMSISRINPNLLDDIALKVLHNKMREVGEEATQRAMRRLPGVVEGRLPLYRVSSARRILEPVSPGRHGDPLAAQPGGKYFALHPLDLTNLMEPDTYTGAASKKSLGKQLKEYMNLGEDPYFDIAQGKIQPKARILKADTQEKWDRVLNAFHNETGIPRNKEPLGGSSGKWDYYFRNEKNLSRDLTDWLRKKYDVVIFPDQDPQGEKLLQAVAINPGHIKAKTWRGHRGLIGAGGAAVGLGAYEATQPDEAEAGRVKFTSAREAAKFIAEQQGLAKARRLASELERSSVTKDRMTRALENKFGLATSKYFKETGKIPSNLTIPSLTGVATLGGMAAYEASQPNESEAMPRGVFTKLTKKATEAMTKGESSSAAKRLIGSTFQGKTVKDVIKSSGDWRAIVFEDGTQMTVNKKDVAAAVRRVGTETYEKAFNEKGAPGRLEQAMKSLKYHQSRVNPFYGRENVRQLHKQYLKRNAEMDPGSVPNTQFVQDRAGNFFQMPSVYAELLEKAGQLKIIRSKQELSTLLNYKKANLND